MTNANRQLACRHQVVPRLTENIFAENVLLKMVTQHGKKIVIKNNQKNTHKQNKNTKQNDTG